jgi:hypothetical protein
VVVDDHLDVDVGDRLDVSGLPARVVGKSGDSRYNFGVNTVYLTLDDARALTFAGEDLASAVIMRGRPSQSISGVAVLTNDDVKDDQARTLASGKSTIDLIQVLLWFVAAGIIGSFAPCSVRSLPHRFFQSAGGSVGFMPASDWPRKRIFTSAGGCAGPFTQVVGAHFHDGQLCIFFNFQQGKGNTDMIIQITFCCISFIFFRQNGMDEFLGSCFSIATGNANDRHIELCAMKSCKSLHGIPCILNNNKVCFFSGNDFGF